LRPIADAGAEAGPDAEAHGVTFLTMGTHAGCAVLAEGKVVCWGLDANGEIPQGTPSTIAPLTTIDVTGAAKASISQGALWVLRHDGTTWQSTAPQIPTMLPDASGVVDVSVGDAFGCVLKDDGAVVCAGYALSDCSSVAMQGPQQIAGIDHARAVSVTSGFGCALDGDGTAKCWGCAPLGASPSAAAIAVPGLDHVVQIATEGAEVCVRRDDGTVWCWTANKPPAQIAGFVDTIDVAVGLGTVCTVDMHHDLRCVGSMWGTDRGTTCNGEAWDAPRVIAAISGVAQIAMGSTSACARKDDGTVWCWGCNGSGELGDGTTISRAEPKRILPF
jgi:alpha-tubulin suppressor-like RCC1 family protein